MKEIPIGEIITSKCRDQKILCKELGESINRSREAARDIMLKPHINTSVLLSISKALHYNFFKDLAAYTDKLLNENNDSQEKNS